MSRYRHPQKAGSKYITPEGKKRLSEEFEDLWRTKRPEVTAALAAAAAEGDRSENAEYIYRKKQLREIDARIHHLKERLEHIVVVDSRPDNRSQVFFGAWVRLEDEEGNRSEYRIVGPAYRNEGTGQAHGAQERFAQVFLARLSEGPAVGSRILWR
ncbi:MAG TPA: transcription elongation factor GreB [Nitrospirota bacterium]|nr:transcription elongation factor GreB [Nitrospirota bacterium]